MDIDSLTDLPHETAEHHDPYEKTHAPHNWWDWYAAYMDAREQEARRTTPLARRAATFRKSSTSRADPSRSVRAG